MIKMRKPIICITMGDPSGVGPEIIMKALKDEKLYQQCNPVVIGDSKILQVADQIVGTQLSVHSISDIEEAKFEFGEVDCIDLNLVSKDIGFGKVSAEAGHAAYCYIEKAIELALDNKVHSICTAPISKEALHKGGHLYPGHTELLAELTGTQDYAMMLTAPNLKVIHVTTHVGLVKAVELITKERVYKTIKLAYETLKKAGNINPKIVVCGINPHAGENGLFGNGEEEEKIVPAVIKAQEEGIQVDGPLPADTLFYRAIRGDFDIVVAMYHDQGHAPIKVLGLEAGVNITIGLPIIRTSVDHGTAFDIAGTGIVNELSLKEAIRQAVSLAPAMI